MDTFPLIATGVASTSLDDEILAIRYTKIVSLNDQKDEFDSLDSLYKQMEKEDSDFTKLIKKEGQIVKEREKLIVHKINEDEYNAKICEASKDIDKDEFNSIFKKSAVKRTKHEGLKRNVKLVIEKDHQME
mgnify:CR=1 FL=1